MEKEKKMKSSLKLLAAAAVTAGIAFQAPAQDKVREISILEDTAPNAMTTKVYELQHVKACDITPFVQNAVTYMDAESKVDRANFKAEGKQLLVVSTWDERIPNVDGIIKALDRPGFLGRADYNFQYYMKYRSALSLANILRDGQADDMFDTGESYYYYDEGYVVRWRDSKSDGNGFTSMIKKLDKPVPQVQLTFTVYEITDDNLKDVGVDYVSWMNGIDGSLYTWSNQILSGVNDDSYNSTTSHGTNFYFDSSYIRLMQQKGLAKVATTRYATVRNRKNSTISFTPNLQSLKKESDYDDYVGSDSAAFTLNITDTLFYLNDTADGAGTLDFSWAIDIQSPAGKTPNGDVIMNNQTLNSVQQMTSGSETVLTTFSREHDVTQFVGIPYLSELPVLKYLFGSETTSKAKTQVVITVKAESVNTESQSNTTPQADEAMLNAQISK